MIQRIIRFLPKSWRQALLNHYRQRSYGPATAVEPIQFNARGSKLINVLAPAFFNPEGTEVITGGAERYLVELSALLQDMGYSVRVYQASDRAWQSEYQSIPVIGLSVGDDRLRLNQRFHQSVDDAALTIYHDFTLAAPYVHRNSLGISHGISWDSQLLQANRRYFSDKIAQIDKAIANCGVLVSVDTNTANWIRATQARHMAKVTVIPNFVDLTKFRPGLIESIQSDQLIALYPRRLSLPRGFWLMVEIVPELLETFPTLEFHFVGQADSEEAIGMKELIASCDQRVRWYSMPWEEMAVVYQQAAVTVIPSLEREGTSLSCLEAMACGCAVVVSNVGGLTDLVIDGHNGLMVKPNKDELKSAIVAIIQNHDLRQRLRHNALEVIQPFSIDRWRQQWRKLIRSLLGST